MGEERGYLCKKSTKEVEKLEMLFMYHSRSRIRIKQVICCFLDALAISMARISKSKGSNKRTRAGLQNEVTFDHSTYPIASIFTLTNTSITLIL